MSSNKKRPFVTQTDVAREAGVSRALVSLVLNDSPKVSPERRKLVLEAADRLGYIGSSIATSIAGNRGHYLVGYLPQSLSNQIFIEIFQGMDRVLNPKGHQIVLMQGSDNPKKEDDSLRALTSLRPDAVVVAGYSGESSVLKAAVRSIPIISVTRSIDLQGIENIVGDDRMAAREATDSLIALGHRSIGHLQLPAHMPYQDRTLGYLEATEAHGLPNHLIATELSREGAYSAVLRLIDHGQLPTALFCANDMIALGAMDAAQERGLKVPEDLSIIGYDNTEMARRVGLSSVDQHAQLMGEAAGKAVLERLGGDSSEHDTWSKPPRLIVRNSIGPAPDTSPLRGIGASIPR